MYSFLLSDRIHPEIPDLGRSSWWQLLWRWSLLGGKGAFLPPDGSIVLVLTGLVCWFRFLRMRKPSPLCWNTTTTWSTSTRTCKLTFDTVSSSLPPFICVIKGNSLFNSTELKQTSLWNKVRSTTQLANTLFMKHQTSKTNHSANRTVPDLSSFLGIMCLRRFVLSMSVLAN